jgi:hypothetical protein
MADRKTPPKFCKGLRHIVKKTAALIIAILIITSCILPVSAGEEDGQDKAVVTDYAWLWGMPAGYKDNFGIGIAGRNLGKISNGDFKFELVGKDDPDMVIASNVDGSGALIAPGYWGDNTMLWISLNIGGDYTGTGLPAGEYQLRITSSSGDRNAVGVSIDDYFTVYDRPFVKYDVGPNTAPNVGSPYYPAGAENYTVNIVGANFLSVNPAEVSVELTDMSETWAADSVSIEPTAGPAWDSLIAARFSKPLPLSPVELRVIVKINGVEAPCTGKLDTVKVVMDPCVNDYKWVWGMPAGYKDNFGIGITGRNLGKISNGDFKFELIGKDDPNKIIATNDNGDGSFITPGYWGDDTLLWIDFNIGGDYTGTGLPAGEYRLRITSSSGNGSEVGMFIDGYFTVYDGPFVKYDVGPNDLPNIGPAYYPAGAENYTVNIVGANFLSVDPVEVSVELTDMNETWTADSVSIEPTAGPPWDSLITAQFSKPLPSSPTELRVIVKINGVEAPGTVKLDTVKVAMNPCVNDYMWLWGMPAGYKDNFGIGITGTNLDRISNSDFKFELVGKDDPDQIIATNENGDGSLIAPGYWGNKTMLWISFNIGEDYTGTGLPAGEYQLKVTSPPGAQFEVDMSIDDYFTVYDGPFVKYDVGPNAPPNVGPAYYPAGAENYIVNIIGANFSSVDPTKVSVELTDRSETWTADSVSIGSTAGPPWDSLITARFSKPLPSSPTELRVIVKINGVEAPCTAKLDTIKAAMDPCVNDYMWLWGMPAGYKEDFGIGITGVNLDRISNSDFKFELVGKDDPDQIIATNDNGDGSFITPGYWGNKTLLWISLNIGEDYTGTGLPAGEYRLRITSPSGDRSAVGMSVNGYFTVYDGPFVKYDVGPNAPLNVGPPNYPTGGENYTVNIVGANFSGVDPSDISVELTDGTEYWTAGAVSVEPIADPLWDSLIVAQFSNSPLPSSPAELRAVVKINGVDAPCTDKLDKVKVVVPALGGTVSISGTAKYGNTLSVDLSGVINGTGVLTYAWKRGTAIVGTDPQYTVVQADIGKAVTVTITGDGIHAQGSLTSASVIPAKADGPAAPAAPTLSSKTASSITLNPISDAEYSKNNGTTWQDSTTFTGLNANTGYSFVARIKGTSTHLPSLKSAAANFTTSGGDQETGGGGAQQPGGGTGSVLPAPKPAEGQKGTTNVANNGRVEATPVADSGSGQATVSVSIDDIGKAAEKAVADANGVKIIQIEVKKVENTSAYAVELPVAALTSNSANQKIQMSTDAGTIVAPSNMLTSADSKGAQSVELKIGVVDKSALNAEAKALIGDNPVIELNLQIDGTVRAWNNPDAPVTVSIPYAPTAAELANPEGLVIWYIDGSGKPVCVPNGHYDPTTGTVTFSTTHFSYYAVSYSKVAFKDVGKGDWYGRAVSFIAARGITGGTGDGNYSPAAKLTRGECIVMLMKAYGIDSDKNPKNNFSDAGNTWYTGYLAAAKRLGISGGVGNNKFAPDKEITRQEMFTLLYNVLKGMGRLPEGTGGKDLSGFSDTGGIASWAREAMTLFVETGTVGGSGGKLFPANMTTRAEMAQVLFNLLSK